MDNKKHKLSKNAINICAFAVALMIIGSVFAFIIVKHEKHKNDIRYEITVIDKYMNIDKAHPERSKFYVIYTYELVNGNTDIRQDTVTELITRDTYRSYRTEIGKKYYKGVPSVDF